MQVLEAIHLLQNSNSLDIIRSIDNESERSLEEVISATKIRSMQQSA